MAIGCQKFVGTSRAEENLGTREQAISGSTRKLLDRLTGQRSICGHVVQLEYLKRRRGKNEYFFHHMNICMNPYTVCFPSGDLLVGLKEAKQWRVLTSNETEGQGPETTQSLFQFASKLQLSIIIQQNFYTTQPVPQKCLHFFFFKLFSVNCPHTRFVVQFTVWNDSKEINITLF